MEEEEKEEEKEEKIQGRFLTLLRFRNSDLGVVCHAAIESRGLLITVTAGEPELCSRTTRMRRGERLQSSRPLQKEKSEKSWWRRRGRRRRRRRSKKGWRCIHSSGSDSVRDLSKHDRGRQGFQIIFFLLPAIIIIQYSRLHGGFDRSQRGGFSGQASNGSVGA